MCDSQRLMILMHPFQQWSIVMTVAGMERTSSRACSDFTVRVLQYGRNFSLLSTDIV